MKVSDRSVVRYPGGKFRARKILEPLIPETANHILSPFFGGGSFELHMTGKGKQVTAIDKFYVLSLFWEVLLKSPKELADILEPHLGNISKNFFKTTQKELVEINEAEHTDDRLLTAAKFFIVNRCSFSGATLSGGFSKESSLTRFTASIVEKVRNFHNKNMTVSHGDCHVLLENIPESVDLLFLDPPYLLEGSKNSLYGVSGTLHKGFNHTLLRDQVVDSGLPFLLTYNNVPEIYQLWKDFEIVEAEWAYGMNKSKKSSELLITNFDNNGVLL